MVEPSLFPEAVKSSWKDIEIRRKEVIGKAAFFAIAHRAHPMGDEDEAPVIRGSLIRISGSVYSHRKSGCIRSGSLRKKIGTEFVDLGFHRIQKSRSGRGPAVQRSWSRWFSRRKGPGPDSNRRKKEPRQKEHRAGRFLVLFFIMIS
jgi:hypothetical protein